MKSRLKVYQRRASKHLSPDENVIAAIHGHQSFVLMLLPEITNYFFGRMVVVTNKRVILFGPGFRQIFDEYALGEGEFGARVGKRHRDKPLRRAVPWPGGLPGRGGSARVATSFSEADGRTPRFRPLPPLTYSAIQGPKAPTTFQRRTR